METGRLKTDEQRVGFYIVWKFLSRHTITSITFGNICVCCTAFILLERKEEIQVGTGRQNYLRLITILSGKALIKIKKYLLYLDVFRLVRCVQVE